MKLLHTADVHLDWLFESMPVSRKLKRREELLRAFEHITHIAVDEECDALLISGDFFHGDTVSDSTVLRTKHYLNELLASGVEVVILPGNHDPSVMRAYRRTLPTDGIYIFAEDKWECIHLKCGLEVWGNGWTSHSDNRHLVPLLSSALDSYKKTCPRVVMMHGQIINSAPSHVESYRPFTLHQLSNLEATYIALGHVHKAEEYQIPDTKAVARYPGTPFRLSFAESSPRSLSIVEITDDEAEISTFDLPDRLYDTVQFNMSLKQLDEVMSEMKSIVDTDVCMRVVLTGLLMDDEQGLKDILLNDFSNSFFHLEVVDRTITAEINNAPINTVRGRFMKIIDEHMEGLDDDSPERAKLLAALRLGLTALGGGSHQ